jgi:hypothetical protein
MLLFLRSRSTSKDYFEDVLQYHSLLRSTSVLQVLQSSPFLRNKEEGNHLGSDEKEFFDAKGTKMNLFER